jgi:hypothetical protein
MHLIISLASPLALISILRFKDNEENISEKIRDICDEIRDISKEDKNIIIRFINIVINIIKHLSIDIILRIIRVKNFRIFIQNFGIFILWVVYILINFK